MFRSPVKRDIIQERLAAAFDLDMAHYLKSVPCTVADVAHETGLNKNTVQGYKTGTTCPPLCAFAKLDRVIDAKHTLNALISLRQEHAQAAATNEDLLHGLSSANEVSARAYGAVLDALADGELDKKEQAHCLRHFEAHVAEGQRMIDLLKAAGQKALPKRPATMKEGEAMSKKGRAA